MLCCITSLVLGLSAILSHLSGVVFECYPVSPISLQGSPDPIHTVSSTTVAASVYYKCLLRQLMYDYSNLPGLPNLNIIIESIVFTIIGYHTITIGQRTLDGWETPT